VEHVLQFIIQVERIVERLEELRFGGVIVDRGQDLGEGANVHLNGCVYVTSLLLQLFQ
jgi:hypothetical protein